MLRRCLAGLSVLGLVVLLAACGGDDAVTPILLPGQTTAAMPPSTAAAATTAGTGTTAGETTTAAGPQLDPGAPAAPAASEPLQMTDNSGRAWEGSAYAIEAGGAVDVSYLGMAGCVGRAAGAPVVAVEIAAGFDLEVFFGSSAGEGDTALVVLDPAGTWVCGDDSVYGLNPLVQFPAAAPGTYRVWVAVKDLDSAPGTLTITTSPTP